MRRGYLDFTGEFAQTVGLDWLPRSWKVVGSRSSPSPGVVRLVLDNYDLPDGPDALLTCEIMETAFERRVMLKLDSDVSPAPAPAMRYFIGCDKAGYDYAVPVERREEWFMWVTSDNTAPGVPPWALRIEGGFTFTDPWGR